jgi:two-component system phosphate regulon sensor histidine kinase PhoR
MLPLFGMLKFRAKICVSNALFFFCSILILVSLLGLTGNWIVHHSLAKRVDQLARQLETSSSQAEATEMLKSNGVFRFYPLAFLDTQGNVLFQSMGLKEDLSLPPEVLRAMEFGRGFSERTFSELNENVYFFAKKLKVGGQDSLFQIGFRSSEIDELKTGFEVGFLLVSIPLLILVSAACSLLACHILQPIQKIIDAIRPFKEGKEECLPRIVVEKERTENEFSHLALIFNALTDRIQKQIENLTCQKEETEEILESIREGIIATDTSANITFVNRTACHMLGTSPEKILKKTLLSVQAEASDLSQKCHELILQALQTREVRVQTWKPAERFYLDLVATPLAHQNGALVVLQDKTSDYKLVQLGKDFIANASHELRTPITVIRGFAETLQDLPKLSKEMLKEITEKIVRTCGRLDKLVRSLLTLADIENVSSDRFKSIDLCLIIESCKHLLITAHPNVHITFKSEKESIPIYADADLLELAILNILENGVKYSTGSAQIKIDVFRIHNEVFLSIEDAGIGIPEESLPHVFDRFYTVDKARSRKSGGAGLGLSIAKTIVEKHNGRITVTSSVGKGSIFTLILPYRFE